MHQDAVSRCGAAKMSDLRYMEVFNKRITAWNALVTSQGLTKDSEGRAYIATFSNSESALPEEADRARSLLE